MTMMTDPDFKALDPFFRIVEQGLEGIADGGHFFDLLAEDVIFDYIITTPGYPRHVEGRSAVAELYRPYGTVIVLDRCHDLAVHHDVETGVVVLEYASRRPSRIDRRPVQQPVHLGTHDHRSQGDALARLPRPRGGLRRARMALALIYGAKVVTTGASEVRPTPRRTDLASRSAAADELDGASLAWAQSATEDHCRSFANQAAHFLRTRPAPAGEGLPCATASSPFRHRPDD